MCRSIKPLFNFAPDATDEEIHSASLQYVRKLSGSPKPSKINEEVFAKAVKNIAYETKVLLDSLVTNAPARNREDEAEKARRRSLLRFGESKSL